MRHRSAALQVPHGSFSDKRIALEVLVMVVSTGGSEKENLVLALERETDSGVECVSIACHSSGWKTGTGQGPRPYYGTFQYYRVLNFSRSQKLPHNFRKSSAEAWRRVHGKMSSESGKFLLLLAEERDSSALRTTETEIPAALSCRRLEQLQYCYRTQVLLVWR